MERRKRLTVSSLCDPRERSPRDAGRWNATPVKPYIRLRGKWLRRLGFEVGTRIEVESGPGRLVLRAVPAGEVCEGSAEE